jgi:energy-coupling factor transporter transmembrane protein EcfT
VIHWARLDPYVYGASVLHRTDSRVKLLCWLLATICVLTTPTQHIWRLAAYTVLLALLTSTARLPLGFVASRLTPALGFAAFAALGLAFQGAPMQFVSTTGRVFLCTWLAVLLTATTAFGALLGGARALGLPFTVVSLTALTWRYVFVIVGEACRTAVAWRCRCPSPNRAAQVRGAAHLTGALAIRAFRRAERVERGLIARGFDGTMRCLPMPPLTAVDIANGCCFAVLVLLAEVAA